MQMVTRRKKRESGGPHISESQSVKSSAVSEQVIQLVVQLRLVHISSAVSEYQ
jgi:hypothetical protein